MSDPNTASEIHPDVYPIPSVCPGNPDVVTLPMTACHVEKAKCTVEGTNPKDLIGVKKPHLELVPAALIIQVAEAMRNGADKFGPYNWRGNKVRASVYVAAAMRHLLQWHDGEEKASDSGVHHLAHAAACLGILLDAQFTGNLADDRPMPGAATALISSLTRS